jgi:hypothetical protein
MGVPFKVASVLAGGKRANFLLLNGIINGSKVRCKAAAFCKKNVWQRRRTRLKRKAAWLQQRQTSEEAKMDHSPSFLILNTFRKNMIQSMTGFVKQLCNYQPKKNSRGKILNSKGLDLNVRMPSLYREMELGLVRK